MEVILQFLRDHYHVIIEFTFLVVLLLITILKKKVKVSNVVEVVLLSLPGFINEAESKFDDGPSKFGYVFNRCIELLVCLTHKDKTVLLDEYSSILNNAIENILTTPQKKER